MISRLRHAAIVARDLTRLVRFYEGLGFELWRRELEQGAFIDQVVGLTDVRVETAKLTAPCGGMLELLQYHSHPVEQAIAPQSSNQLGSSHIALTVASIEEASRFVREQGGSLVNPPATAPNGAVAVAYCHDPEGNLLELVEEY